MHWLPTLSSKHCVALTFVVAVCCGPPAYAQIPEATWDRFAERSLSRFHREDAPLGFEDFLYEAATSSGDQTEALAAFARRIGVSPDVGIAYASVIVESVQRQSLGCALTCTFAPGDAFYDRVARLASKEPTGQLLIAIGKNLYETERVHDQGWVALAVEHPAAQPVLQALFDYAEDVPLLVAMFATTAPASWNPRSIATASGALDDGPDRWDGWLNAFIELAERRAQMAQAPVEVQAAIAQLALSHELELGLTSNAVRRYLAYPDDLRRRLPVAITPSDATCRTTQGYTFIDNLAVALWQTNHPDESRSMLDRAPVRAEPGAQRARDRLAALADILAPAIPDDELFDRYLVPAGSERHVCDWPAAGWFDAVTDAPLLGPLAAGRLRAAGYADLATALESTDLYRRDDARQGVLGGYARFFPDSVRTAQARWAKIIDDAWQAAARRPSVEETEAVTSTNRLLWPESRLPPGIAPWNDAHEPHLPPENLSLPFDRDAIVRYEPIDGEHAILYQSSDYDLPGEVPAFGVWFARTEQGQWVRPLYLGLTQYFPYVVTRGSGLALLNGDILQIEVQVREINPATITFPPIATELLRSEDGLYLSIDLAKVESDLDGDGLTDIEERTLGLDASNPDTDGDGVPDGRDALPLTAYRPGASPNDVALARAIVNKVLGHDQEAIFIVPSNTPLAKMQTRERTVFLLGDASIFEGLAIAPFRLLIYNHSDIRALGRGPAPFHPPELRRVFSSHDRRRHYVEWSTGWSGGRFLVTCAATGGACEIEELSSWVT